MLAARRNKNRSEIRRGQLENLFAFRRKELLEGNEGVVQELHREILGYDSGGDHRIFLKVLQYLEQHPEDENAYIMLGNLLVGHCQEFLPNFFNLICDSPQYLANYSWCLTLMVY